MDHDTGYRVDGWPGIAFYYAGPQTVPDEDTVWTGIENETGLVNMVMVGDDREWPVDPDDCEPLAEEEYCSTCGQIGCGW